MNILVDTSPKSRWKKLDRTLQDLNISRLDYLILTHAHYDHAENANRLKNKYKCLVVVHKSEAELLNNGLNPVVAGTNVFSRLLVRMFIGKFTKISKYDPCQHDIAVETEYDLKKLGVHAYILHTPGHTAGSISLIIDNEIAIVGDCMFGVFRNSVFPPFAENTELLIKSWGRLLETECRLFLPSHGKEKTVFQLAADYEKRK